MIRCLTAARFTMKADILTWTGITEGGSTDVTPGHWEDGPQDPITGEVRNVWVPESTGNSNDPATPINESFRTIDCLARGIVDGGIRVAGSTERFGDTYENIEFAKLWIPSRIKLTKRDQVTNIRSKVTGSAIWTDEDGSPTIFNVNGVSPLFDAFNRQVESFILLERAS